MFTAALRGSLPITTVSPIAGVIEREFEPHDPDTVERPLATAARKGEHDLLKTTWKAQS